MPTNPGGAGSNTSGYSSYKKNYGSGGFGMLSDDSFSSWLRGMGGGTIWHDQMTEELYNSMTPADWDAFKKMSASQQDAFLWQRARDIKAAGEQDTEKIAREGQQKAIIAKLQAFAEEMNMPIDQLLANDQFAQALRNTTVNRAQSTAQGRGIGGGMSMLNADQSSKKALLGYQMQRQQMGNQALNQAYGMLSNQNMQSEDLRRYNQGLDLQMQGAQAAARAQQYAQGQQTFSNIAGIAGGAIGAYYGGPQGYAMGSAIGSAGGGALYGAANPYTPYQYSYPTGKSGMTKTSYGGNY